MHVAADVGKARIQVKANKKGHTRVQIWLGELCITMSRGEAIHLINFTADSLEEYDREKALHRLRKTRVENEMPEMPDETHPPTTTEDPHQEEEN